MRGHLLTAARRRAGATTDQAAREAAARARQHHPAHERGEGKKAMADPPAAEPPDTSLFAEIRADDVQRFERAGPKTFSLATESKHCFCFDSVVFGPERKTKTDHKDEPWIQCQ